VYSPAEVVTDWFILCAADAAAGIKLSAVTSPKGFAIALAVTVIEFLDQLALSNCSE